MAAILSVVVPFYNTEPYFAQCLDSLAAQTLRDLQVVLVDDGSTDGSARIAREYTNLDPRFTLLTVPHRGLSAARNAGAQHAAAGTYLAFADSDDVVPPNGYHALVTSLEATGSDIASGDVRRLNSAGLCPHPRYAGVFAAARTRTHITRDTSLVLDRMIWNKAFRRSFWDEHGLAFTLPQYEDAPTTVRAHILAESVDVVGEVVYHWRVRETGEPSITQRLYEPGNLAARMTMMVETGALIRRMAPGLTDVYERDMCLGDLRIAMTAMLHGTDEDLAHALGLARAFLAAVDPGVLGALPERDRRHLYLLAAGKTGQLREELRAEL